MVWCDDDDITDAHLETERDKIMYARQKEDSIEGLNNISTAFRNVVNDLTPIIGHYLTALYPWRRRPVAPSLDTMMSWYPQYVFDDIRPGIPCDDFAMYPYLPNETWDHGSICDNGTRMRVVKYVRQGNVRIYFLGDGPNTGASIVLQIIIDKLVKQVTNKI